MVYQFQIDDSVSLKTVMGIGMFGTILISTVTLMHVYVFWRVSSVPFVTQHIPRKILTGIAILLWGLFYLGRVAGHGQAGNISTVLEFLGMTWMAALFLTFVFIAPIDLMTLFGFFLPKMSPLLREWAFLAGIILSGIALVQGLRPPVIQPYEVSLPNLPKALDGTVIVAFSDTHLGSQLSKKWLAPRVAQINEQKPNLVVLLGDIFEGHGPPADQWVPI